MLGAPPLGILGAAPLGTLGAPPGTGGAPKLGPLTGALSASFPATAGALRSFTCVTFLSLKPLVISLLRPPWTGRLDDDNLWCLVGGYTLFGAGRGAGAPPDGGGGGGGGGPPPNDGSGGGGGGGAGILLASR